MNQDLIKKYKADKLIILIQIIVIVAMAGAFLVSARGNSLVSPGIDSWQSAYTAYENGAWTADESISVEDEYIDLIYGPYMRLPKGCYSVSIDYASDNDSTFEIHSFEKDDVIYVEEEEILGEDSNSVTCHFYLSEPVEDLEIRVHYNGKGSISIYNINVAESSFVLRELLLRIIALFVIADFAIALRRLCSYRKQTVHPVNTLKVFLGVMIFTVTYLIALRLTREFSDYSVHGKFADGIFRSFSVVSTYPLWHVFVKFIDDICGTLLGMPINYAVAICSGIANLSVYLFIDHIFRERGYKYSEVVSFLIMFVSPLYMPWFNEQLYLGQSSPNTWHSPTAIIVKPFAFAAFFLAVEICNKIHTEEEIRREDYYLLSLVVFLSVLAKPSFFQGFVPALGLYIIIDLAMNKMKGFKQYLFVVCSFIPAFVVVLGQIVVSFYIEDRAGGIEFGWMEVWKYYSPNPMISFILVLAFPILYIVLYFKDSMKDDSVRMALLFVLSGFLEYAVICEKGERRYHGNFGWALQLSYAVLWVVTTGKLMEKWKNTDAENMTDRAKNTALMVVWLFHFICGVYYAGLFFVREGFLY